MVVQLVPRISLRNWFWKSWMTESIMNIFSAHKLVSVIKNDTAYTAVMTFNATIAL